MSLSIILIWASLLLGMIVLTWVGRKANFLPIVSQLLIGALLLPIYYYFFLAPDFTTKELVTEPLIRNLYIINFAILFGYILSDVIDFSLKKESFIIALPSFFVPFFTGLTFAYFILSHNTLTSVSIGLLFSITAIPVLFIFLKAFNYSAQDTKTLIHTAIVIDVLCWTIFAVAKESVNLSSSIYYSIAFGFSPFLLKYIVKKEFIFSLLFFLLMIVLEMTKLNSLVFGILFMVSLSFLKIPFILPIPKNIFMNYQTWFAIPFIIIYGMIQINYNEIVFGHWLLVLLVLPIITKIIGNWIGLVLSGQQLSKKDMIRHALILNTRGLTEIVFLNMLFQQKIISADIYLALMIMGLISTIMPSIYENYLIKKNKV